MPEAAVYEDNHPMAWQHQVRYARQIPPMQPEPVSEAVYHRPNRQFRLHVSRSNLRHAPGPVLWA